MLSVFWVVPLKDKKGVTTVNELKRSEINQDVNQAKCGLTKEKNFTTVLLKNG